MFSFCKVVEILRYNTYTGSNTIALCDKTSYGLVSSNFITQPHFINEHMIYISGTITIASYLSVNSENIVSKSCV